MHLLVFSDLHQEWPGTSPHTHRPPISTWPWSLVTSICRFTRDLAWFGEHLPGVPTIYVPSNHDFWWDHGEEHHTQADQMSRCRDVAARLGIHLLLDDAIVIMLQ